MSKAGRNPTVPPGLRHLIRRLCRRGQRRDKDRQVLYVGDNNGNAARALIKVNSLWQNRDYLAIAGDVTEAYLRVRDLGCYATPTAVSYYTATSSWQEDTVTCSGRIWPPGTYVSCNTIYNSNGVDLWGNGSGNL